MCYTLEPFYFQKHLKVQNTNHKDQVLPPDVKAGILDCSKVAMLGFFVFAVDVAILQISSWH